MRQTNPQKDLFTDAPVWEEGLTRRQKLFVEAYCTDRSCFLDPAAAYIKVYGGRKELTAETAQQSSSRLLRNPAVKDAVGRLLKAAQAKEDRLSEYQVLDIIKTLTTYNPADIITRDGRLRLGPEQDLSALGPLALCITGIKQTKYGVEIKLYDRTKAASILAQYLDLIRPVDVAAAATPMVAVTPKEALEAENAEYRIMNAPAGGA